jgi:hypothetical protein
MMLDAAMACRQDPGQTFATPFTLAVFVTT